MYIIVSPRYVVLIHTYNEFEFSFTGISCHVERLPICIFCLLFRTLSRRTQNTALQLLHENIVVKRISTSILPPERKTSYTVRYFCFSIEHPHVMHSTNVYDFFFHI